MRTFKDRVRHALSFEIIGLILITPLVSWVFRSPMNDIGVVAFVGATIATLWNYTYNLAFDHAMLRWRGDTQKTLPLRILHAILFELGILIALMPFIALYLGISLFQAFLMDVSFALFYLFYAFVFNWAYDIVFPVGASHGAPLVDSD